MAGSTMSHMSRDDAMSPILGFIGAMAAFSLSLVLFLSYASSPITESSTVDSDLQNRALTGLHLMITDSGDWLADPDNMKRFGMAGDEANFLDYDKIKALRKGKISESVNGYPDYPEVKRALGLDGYQFHIRTYPVLIGKDDAQWAQLRGMSVAYVADSQDPTSSATITRQTVLNGNVEEIHVTITNKDASDMIFTVNFNLEVKDGKTVSTTRQTRVLSLDESETIVLRLHPLQSWVATDMPVEVEFVVTDNYGVCSCAVAPLDANPQSDGLAPAIHYLSETDGSYYELNEQVTVKVDHFNKNGGKNSGQDARLRVYPPSAPGAETPAAVPDVDVLCSADPSCGSLPNQNGQRWEYACSCAHTKGLWTVLVTDPAGARETAYTYWVSDVELFPGLALHPTAINERDYIDELVSDFDPALYPAGDVFVDTNQDVRELLPYIDANPDCASNTYDVVIVGSNVAHNALVKIKNDVESFVSCGGTLVALGSSRSGTEWLQEVYHVALRDGAGGGIATPDPTHPLLNVPEKLSWNLYSDTDYVWDIEPGEDIWSHAVNGANEFELMLGVSEQGALTGSVVLTGWTPGELTDPQNHDEAKKLMHNLLAQGYQMLFLDYGPPIPEGVPVGSSSRLVAIPYEELQDVPYVEVRVVLYAWRG